MTTRECNDFVSAYATWLVGGVTAACLPGGAGCEITTPFLDRHNDHLQVYVVPRAGGFELTDDGHVLTDLKAAGFELNTPKRTEAVQVVLNGFDVQRDGNRLVSGGGAETIGERMHYFVQAMLAVGDMHVMGRPSVASYFKEDVGEFFDAAGVRYVTDTILKGKSGLGHPIDFVIPKSDKRPERFVQTISDRNKNAFRSCLLTLSDTREARGGDSEAYVMLGKGVIHTIDTSAMNFFRVKPVPWSARADIVPALLN